MLTETVTFGDLIGRHKSELSQLRDAYDDLQAYAAERYDDRAEWPDELQRKHNAYQQTANQIEARITFLENFSENCDGDAFEIRTLSGRETMEIDTKLKTKANQRNVDMEVVSHERNALVVDAATVDAPDCIPHEDGDPVPSDAPDAVVQSLSEVVSTFTQSGSVDFQASGFGDQAGPDASGISPTPTTSDDSLTTADPDAETTDSGGDN
jgi:hypothetical protein